MFFTLGRLIWGFFSTFFQSIGLFFSHLFGKRTQPIPENKFLDTLNFIANIGPKSFWKQPTGIKIGRSIATLIHYVFYKETHFHEKQK